MERGFHRRPSLTLLPSPLNGVFMPALKSKDDRWNDEVDCKVDFTNSSHHLFTKSRHATNPQRVESWHN
jgi:hypothetical protein